MLFSSFYLFFFFIFFVSYLKSILKLPNRGVKSLLTILQSIVISESRVANVDTSYNHLLIFFFSSFFQLQLMLQRNPGSFVSAQQSK